MWVSRFLRLFARFRRDPRHRRGRRAERLAARFLRRHGHRILARNLFVGHDEADLLTLDPDGVYVIVEVRARRAGGRATPEQTVNAAKRRHLLRLARTLYRGGKFGTAAVRFDVIAVEYPPRGRPVLRWHRAAFCD